VLPTSLAAPGTLGDDLALLFPAADIARSSRRDLVTSGWDGDAFVAPA